MEGTPFLVENNAEDDEAERRKAEEAKAKPAKPEMFGMLAVEPGAEAPTLSAIEEMLERSRRPAAETEDSQTPAEKPPEEPVVRTPDTIAPAEEIQVPAPAAAERVEPEPAPPEPEPQPPVIEAAPEPPAPAEEAALEQPPAPPLEEQPVVVEAPPQSEQLEQPKAPPVPEVQDVVAVEQAPPPTAEETTVESESAGEPEPVVKIADAPMSASRIIETQPKPEPAPEPEPEPVLQPPVIEAAPEPPASAEAVSTQTEIPEAERPVEVAPVAPKIPEPAPESAPEVPTAEPESEASEQPTEQLPAPPVEAQPEPIQIEGLTNATPEPAAPSIESTTATPAPQEVAPRDMHVEDIRPPVATAPVESGPKPAGEAQVSSLAAEEKMRVEASPVEPSTGKRVEALNKEELLDVSEKIIVNGETLRHAFETHMIGEQGLRRLVAEHLRGGNLYEALRREIVEHQMDFERDPVMRGRAPTAVPPVTAHTQTLDTLLANADVSLPANERSTAEASPPPPAIPEPIDDDQAWKHSSGHRLADVVLAGVIGGLIFLIIIVYLIRH